MDAKYIEKLEFNRILDILSDNCVTDIGKILALNLRPNNKKDIVFNLLKETTEATNLIYKKHLPPFVEIADITYILKILKSDGVLNSKSLLDVAKILKLANSLKTYYIDDNEKSAVLFPILENYFSSLYTNLSIQTEIEKCILDEDIIADNASKELEIIRKKQKLSEESIKNKLNSFIHSASYSKYIQESVITIRNDRYVIPVKEEYRSMIKGFVHDVSASGSTLFIEPMNIFELNNELANLKADEYKEIERILIRLTRFSLPYCRRIK